MQEDGNPAYGYRTVSGPKIIRGKGCEESFRAAVVDKYNKHLDPNHRSEVSAKKHWLLDPPTEGEREIDGFSNVRGGVRQSSLNAALDRKNKSAKKKPGLFKGIGSMFRFGKYRKMDFNAPEVQHYQQTEEHGDGGQHQEQQIDTNHNERLQEQDQQREQIYQRHGFVHRHAEQVQVIPENSVPISMKYRSGGSHLSGDHQRRSDRQSKSHHQKIHHRHSHYPSDDRNTLYEQVSRQVSEPLKLEKG